MIWDIAGVIAWTLLVAGSLISLFVVLVMAVEMYRQRSAKLDRVSDKTLERLRRRAN